MPKAGRPTRPLSGDRVGEEMKSNRSAQHNRDKMLDACQILAVDDDPGCIAEYEDLIGNLGYSCVTASSGPDAIQCLIANDAIGIVLLDLKMPDMDGLTLLDELTERFMAYRPLVPIVVTGDATIESAVLAMRSNAIDFLDKPISIARLAAALRRARARWNELAVRMAGQAMPVAATGFGSRAQGHRVLSGGPTDNELQELAVALQKTQQSRTKFFDSQVITGPAWDILVDLAAAGLAGKRVAASSACAATNAPLTTALRHVNNLVEAGIVRRTADPSDKRRTLLELEPHALELMTQYLSTAWTTMAGKYLASGSSSEINA